MESPESTHQLGQSRGAGPNLLQLQLAGAGFDVGDHHITVILAALRSLALDAVLGTSSGSLFNFLLFSLLGWVVVVPETATGVLGLLLSGKVLRCISGLLSRVGMHSRQTLLQQDLGEVLLVHVEGSDKATDLVNSLDVDFDISLHAPSVGQLMRLLAKRLPSL